MRRTLVHLGAIAALALTAPAGFAAPPPMEELVKTELSALTDKVEPNATLRLDLHFAIAPGWHIYWKNPGDSGLPTTVELTLPPGFARGATEWPIPQRFAAGGIVDYGYSGAADLHLAVAAPADLAPGASQTIAAAVKWLVCSNVCIPGERTLSLTLPAGMPGKPDPAVAARFAAARMPLPLLDKVRFTVSPHEFRVDVPADALEGLDRPTAYFFPDDDNVIDYSGEQRNAIRGGALELTLPRSAASNASVPAELRGVLALRGADGRERGFLVSIARAAAPMPSAGLPGWWQALGFAFVGGLILNLMPCVFPILSLKLLSLIGAPDPAARRHHGLAYAAGVVLSFAALGAALVVLRTGGAAIGWGFQLQSPLFVALLAYLMLTMGLSLSGVADFGAGFAGVGDRLAGRGGLLGAFFTGVLATVVATPCTAPFMAAALGVALLAPAPLGLAIFVALGAGLAAPLLAASLVPALARALPRPGAWMAVLKQALAFPLYGTVAWLVWVLIQEVAPAGAFAALLGLVLVGFAVWAYGRSRLAAPAARRVGGVFAAAGLAGALVVAAMLPRAGAAVESPAGGGLAYEKFTAERLAALTAAHKPVFVNLTAAWCITCLVNERATLDRDAVRDALAAHHVVALRGDWTRQDPEIAAFLERFGRSGVPLYLLYDGSGAATVLPQILTEAEVIDAVDKL